MNGMRLQTLQISHLTVVTLTASPNPALKRGFVTFVYSFCGRLFINFFSASSSILKLSGKLQYNCLCALHLLITLQFFFCISYYIVSMYKFISPAHKCSTLKQNKISVRSFDETYNGPESQSSVFWQGLHDFQRLQSFQLFLREYVSVENISRLSIICGLSLLLDL